MEERGGGGARCSLFAVQARVSVHINTAVCDSVETNTCSLCAMWHHARSRAGPPLASFDAKQFKRPSKGARIHGP